jgi:hypothetical protein
VIYLTTPPRYWPPYNGGAWTERSPNEQKKQAKGWSGRWVGGNVWKGLVDDWYGNLKLSEMSVKRKTDCGTVGSWKGMRAFYCGNNLVVVENRVNVIVRAVIVGKEVPFDVERGSCY